MRTESKNDTRKQITPNEKTRNMVDRKKSGIVFGVEEERQIRDDVKRRKPEQFEGYCNRGVRKVKQ